MRAVFVGLAFILSLLTGSLADSWAQSVNLGVSIGEDGLKGFHLSIGEYYRVPQREVIIIRERGIPDDEIPVVLLVAQRARVAPATIIDLRRRGKTWTDIVLYFDLSPEIFYVEVEEVEVKGPPYGKAYGHYKNKPKREWKRIVLKDDEVINLVNLKFISEHHGYRPKEVIEMRSRGKAFVAINDEVKKGKKKKWDESGERRERHPGKGKGKGKGNRDRD